MVNRAAWAEQMREQLDEKTFVRSLLAALRLAGITHIPTANDDHQLAFALVIGELDARTEKGDRATHRMPFWCPGPVTGKYEELDDALFHLQASGVVNCDSRYHVVGILLDEGWAQRSLDRLSEEEQGLFRDLSIVFSDLLPHSY
jgi:hypothetical protein